MNTPSPWDDPRVTAYVMGELSGDERVAFETEIANDAELAAAVDEARRVTNKLEGLFAAESTPTLDQGRRDTIVSGATVSTNAAADPLASWKVPLLLLATAAVVALMIGIAPMMSDRSVTVSQQVPKSENGLATLNDAVEQEEEELAQTGFDPIVEQRSYVGDPLETSAPDELEGSRALSQANKPMPSPIGNIAVEIEFEKDIQYASGRELSEAQPVPAMSTRLSREPSVKENAEMESAEVSGEDTMRMDVADGDLTPMKGGGMGRSMEGMESKNGTMTGGMVDLGATMPSEAARDNSIADSESLLSIPGEPQIMKESLLNESLAKNRSRLKRSQLLETRFDVQPPDIIVLPTDVGRGPGDGGDKFDPITDNAFKRVDEHAMSTFSIDVDTASYSKTRDFLMRANRLPRADAVRIEELVNYFDYDYTPPANDAEHPFAAAVTITSCPWNSDHRLARIAIKGKTMQQDERPQCNLVFLIDTSGSMNAPNKLPLVIDGMKMLLKQLGDKDRVAITVYAGSAGLVLDSTPAKKGKKIRKALTQLSSGGSTNGGAGIQLAYQTARDNFIKGGVNRVILCSDGDFNVGTTGTDELVRMVEQEAKGGVFLSVLGFGMGNHNDAMLEQISGRGNGNYAFIDTEKEAHKVLVDQVAGTLVTIAKDVKLQVDFNPTKVSSYRLIGYENRVLAKEDFNDDQKDAGEIGAGHSVTALYEIVPVGIEADASRPKVDDSRYQKKAELTEAADSNETLTLKLRYKQPDGDTSTLVEFPVIDEGGRFDGADVDTRFAAAVAGFGMQLRHSEYAGSWTIADVLRVAKSAKGDDIHELRSEFVELVEKAQKLMGGQ